MTLTYKQRIGLQKGCRHIYEGWHMINEMYRPNINLYQSEEYTCKHTVKTCVNLWVLSIEKRLS